MSGKIPYHGYIECKEYAISALAHVVEPVDRDMINIDKLILMIDEVLNDKNSNIPAFELAQVLKEKQPLILQNWLSN